MSNKNKKHLTLLASSALLISIGSICDTSFKKGSENENKDYSSLVARKAYLNKSSKDISIHLDKPFSKQGVKKVLDLDFGDELNIPNPIAICDGKKIEASTSIKYLTSEGWQNFTLPENRKFTVGDSNSNKDRGRALIYEFNFSAINEGITKELKYTIYAGMQFVNYSKWCQRVDTGFKNEKIKIAKTKILLKGLKDTSGDFKARTNRFNKIITAKDLEQKVYFSELDDNLKESDITSSISKDNDYFTPKKAGNYRFEFTTPSNITLDLEGESKINLLSQKYSISHNIIIYDERNNPLNKTAKDGIYECGYIIGDTSPTGEGMIADSCKSSVEIEKLNKKYYLHFTQTQPYFMFNLCLSVDNKDLGNIVFKEGKVNGKDIKEYIFTLSEDVFETDKVGIKTIKPIHVSMYIVPMKRDVHFSVQPDVVNAFYKTSKTYDIDERPADYVPMFNTNSDAIVKPVDSKIIIPKISASLAGSECPTTCSVYQSTLAGKKPISLLKDPETSELSFTPHEKGDYYIVYRAESDLYKTSKGNPTFTTFERRVIIGDKGQNITPDGNNNNDKPSKPVENETITADTTVPSNDNNINNKSSKTRKYLLIGGAAFLVVFIALNIFGKRKRG